MGGMDRKTCFKRDNGNLEQTYPECGSRNIRKTGGRVMYQVFGRC